MTSKTREFKLTELTIFNNELIHFFNINPYNSSIYISLEVDGKKMKLNNSEKINLGDIIPKIDTEEINYNIIEEVELKMKFKIMDKFNKKTLFESFKEKLRESKVKWNQQKINAGQGVFETGISIKDRIKMFSGGESPTKQNNTKNYKPGKLKMPIMFQNSNKSPIKSNNNINRKSKNETNKDNDEKKSEIKEKNKNNQKAIKEILINKKESNSIANDKHEQIEENKINQNNNENISKDNADKKKNHINEEKEKGKEIKLDDKANNEINNEVYNEKNEDKKIISEEINNNQNQNEEIKYNENEKNNINNEENQQINYKENNNIENNENKEINYENNNYINYAENKDINNEVDNNINNYDINKQIINEENNIEINNKDNNIIYNENNNNNYDVNKDNINEDNNNINYDNYDVNKDNINEENNNMHNIGKYYINEENTNMNYTNSNYINYEENNYINNNENNNINYNVNQGNINEENTNMKNVDNNTFYEENNYINQEKSNIFNNIDNANINEENNNINYNENKGISYEENNNINNGQNNINYNEYNEYNITQKENENINYENNNEVNAYYQQNIEQKDELENKNDNNYENKEIVNEEITNKNESENHFAENNIQNINYTNQNDNFSNINDKSEEINQIKKEEETIIYNENKNEKLKNEISLSNNLNFDNEELYEEREYNSEDEEENGEQNLKNNENKNNEIINNSNEITQQGSDNSNNYLKESSTFHSNNKKVNFVENSLQYQYTSKIISVSTHEKPKGTPSFKSTSGDIFLESMNYATYLRGLKKKGIKESKRETFCEGFFIASFPYKNGSVIEKSQMFPAQCGHTECSKLPGMKPEIIIRYPLEDTQNLEMNNLAATICFPTGIKVCYSEEKPYNIKDYVIPITNQKGDRYYMMTHHFYQKISRDEYDKRYEMHPLKHHLKNFGDAYLSLSEQELDNEVKEIQSSLELCQELGFRDYLYIPYCLCLISKYPYVNELKKCLRCIYRILSKEKLKYYINPEEAKFEINNLIMHLIHSVPIPDPNSSVKFFLPYYHKEIEINCPKIEDINIMSKNTCTLLKVFSVEHIMTIYKLILNEKKILFIDKYYERLAKVTDGFISLLYPLQWIHTYIPIMSDQMLKYLETFLPFLNGINESLMPLVKDIFNETETENEELFLVYINEDKIKLGSSLKNGVKKIKTDKYISENIPAFPYELEKKLKKKLKKMKSEFSAGQKKDKNSDNEEAELRMRDAFIEFFVGMFHDYEKYLYLLDEQDVVFNKSLFLETIPNNEKNFYSEIIDTQLFQQFTQNIIKEDFNYFNNKIISYREKMEKKKQKAKKDKEKKLYVKPEILYHYVVSPIYLNIKDTDVRNIELSLSKSYPNPIKDFSIISEVFSEKVEIDDNKYINENCLIFLTPDQIKSEQTNIDESKSIELRKSVIPKLTGKMINIKKSMNIKLSTNRSIIDMDNNATEKRKDEIREYIRDFAAKIFRSEINDIDNSEKNELINVTDTTYGREFFVNLLSHNTGNLLLLQKNSFKLLGNIIYNTLIGTFKLEETDKLLEEIVLLIKSTKYFGLEEKGKTKNIFDVYKKKLQSTPKVVQYNFWKKKYDIDLRNKENKDNSTKQQIIYNIVSEMIELEIAKSTIKNITEKISNEVFGKDSELSKETFKVFIKQITKAHYISKARVEN